MNNVKLPGIKPPTKLPVPPKKIEEVKEETAIVEEDDVDSVQALEQALTQQEESVESAEDVIMEDFFATTKNDYNSFDTRAWNKGDGYKIPGYPEMEDKLEGLESGLYLFAGESNSGKSALMMNILKDICSCRDNKLYGIYYSLDDSKHEIIPRIIAMEQEIPIAVASKPQRFKNMIETCDNDNVTLYQEQLEKREIGLEKLRKESDVFKIEDTTKIKNHNDLKKHIVKVQTFIKSIDPEMNIIIAIDSINDIKVENMQDKQKAEFVATFVKDIAVELDIVIFSSLHLRKLNGNRRPTVDDLKEANTLLYEASVVWLVYNDVSKNKGGAKVFWQDNLADDNLGAVIEIDWGKNKKSSFKGRTFAKFRPYYSLCLECKKEENKRFDQIIYQS
jgi:replicative DNA helicase